MWFYLFIYSHSQLGSQWGMLPLTNTNDSYRLVCLCCIMGMIAHWLPTWEHYCKNVWTTKLSSTLCSITKTQNNYYYSDCPVSRSSAGEEFSTMTMIQHDTAKIAEEFVEVKEEKSENYDFYVTWLKSNRTSVEYFKVFGVFSVLLYTVCLHDNCDVWLS